MKNTIASTTRPFANTLLRRQAGISSLQIVVALAVGALLLTGGVGGFKYIEQQKVNNDMAELGDIRAGLVDFASKHNTTFTGFTLNIGCKQQVFPDTRCSGTGATAAVSNIWGGSYSGTIVNLNSGTNNGYRLGSSGLSDNACIKEIGYQWTQWAKIEVGTTVVKANPTDPIDDDDINNACAGGTNTVYWTVKA